MKTQRGKSCIFKSERLSVCLRLRSGLELGVASLLDKDPRVKSLQYEKVRVPWMQREKQRVYIPDFTIGLERGGYLVVEVKPEGWARRTVTQQKARAAIIQLEPLRIGFQIWTERDLERFKREGISWGRLLSGRDLVRRSLILGGRMEKVWLSGLLAAACGEGGAGLGKLPLERRENLWVRSEAGVVVPA